MYVSGKFDEIIKAYKSEQDLPQFGIKKEDDFDDKPWDYIHINILRPTVAGMYDSVWKDGYVKENKDIMVMVGAPSTGLFVERTKLLYDETVKLTPVFLHERFKELFEPIMDAERWMRWWDPVTGNNKVFTENEQKRIGLKKEDKKYKAQIDIELKHFSLELRYKLSSKINNGSFHRWIFRFEMLAERVLLSNQTEDYLQRMLDIAYRYRKTGSEEVLRIQTNRLMKAVYSSKEIEVNNLHLIVNKRRPPNMFDEMSSNKVRKTN